ncbi:MAG TPA: DUF202 domain-containing protein [Micromonosporaceae bacterium]|nr:DUF202 domain-containing protein [Micromonosporaceae bacterium]
MNRDPGLQPERTVLAWRRTALAVTIVTVLTIRMALQRGLADIPFTALAVAGWVTIVAITYRQHAAVAAGRLVAPSAMLPLAALVTTGYAGLGLVLILSSL